MRARWAAGAAVLALAGCVGPAALSLTPPAVAPTPPDSVVTPEAPTASPVAVEAASVDAAQVRAAQAEAERARARAAEASASAAAVASSTPAPAAEVDWRAGEGVAGVDVSRYQPRVDWPGLLASGHLFTYVKATEGTQHVSPTHDDQRAKRKTTSALNHLGHTVYENHFFFQIQFCWVYSSHCFPSLALELKSRFTGCSGQRRHTTVVKIATPVEYDFAYSFGHCAFGDHFTNNLGSVDVSTVFHFCTDFFVHCAGGNQRGPCFVIDNLGINMIQAAKNVESRPLLRT